MAKSKHQKQQDALERLTVKIAERLAQSKPATFAQRKEYNALKAALGIDGAIIISEPPRLDFGTLKRTLLHSEGLFTHCVGEHWFIESFFGQYHWRDPVYGGDNTMRIFDGDFTAFCKTMGFSHGTDGSRHRIKDYCGEDFVLIA